MIFYITYMFSSFPKSLIMFVARSVMFFWAIRLCLHLHRRAVMKIPAVHVKLKFDYHNMGQKVYYGRKLQCLLFK